MSTLPLDVSKNRNVTQNGSVRRSVDLCTLGETEERDFSKRSLKQTMERHASLEEKSFSELLIGMFPRHSLWNVDNPLCVNDHFNFLYSPVISSLAMPRGGGGGDHRFEPHPTVAEAWDALRRSLVYFRGQPVGTIAALDNSDEKLNYDQVFSRDFVPSGLAFLMNGEPEIVKNFTQNLRLQSWEKKIDRFQLVGGVMPASFKVLHDPVRNNETLIAHFGKSAIGRVAPVDLGFLWIILLRAYTKSTGDTSMAELPDCQKGMRLILCLCLSEGFETFSTLLCADGCCMIDRRMVTVRDIPVGKQRKG